VTSLAGDALTFAVNGTPTTLGEAEAAAGSNSSVVDSNQSAGIIQVLSCADGMDKVLVIDAVLVPQKYETATTPPLSPVVPAAAPSSDASTGFSLVAAMALVAAVFV